MVFTKTNCKRKEYLTPLASEFNKTLRITEDNEINRYWRGLETCQKWTFSPVSVKMSIMIFGQIIIAD